MFCRTALFCLAPCWIGCATIFGWDIHAPGVLSSGYFQKIQPIHERLALYLDPALASAISKNRGSKTADPQTYHIGEAFAPMLVEGFQQGFDEFVLMEVEPTSAMLKQYGIRHLAAVRLLDFSNRVSWHGQALLIRTEAVVYDSDMKELTRFESTGSSDAEKIFSKKGGPEVNLNGALENNVLGIVQYLQDCIRNGAWK